jgi:broad specificity phosphatase PhoE
MSKNKVKTSTFDATNLLREQHKFIECFSHPNKGLIKTLFRFYKGHYKDFLLASLFFFLQYLPHWVLPIITANELMEFNFGEWEGLTLEEIKNSFDDGYSKWAKDPGVFVPNGGEAMSHLQERVVKKLKEIGEKEDGKTVLIGSHSSVIRALQCYMQGLPLTKMKNTPWVVNGSFAEINFDKEDFYICKYGFDGHLANL